MLKTYNEICSGTRRSFRLTAGLSEGYGASVKVHTLAEANVAYHAWALARAQAGESFLTGAISSELIVYAYPKSDYGPAGTGVEDGFAFAGDVSMLYSTKLTDGEVRQILTDLATAMGNALGQTRIYLSYREVAWVMEVEKGVTPTGN